MSGVGDRYARFYTFTLDEAADMIAAQRHYARSVPAGLTVEEMKPRPMKAYYEFIYIYDMVFGEKAERSRSNS